MKKKIIIIVVLLFAAGGTLFLIPETTIDAELVEKEFKNRLPDCELISVADFGSPHHEDWDVTYKNKKGESIKAWWQIRNTGFFFDKIEVVMGQTTVPKSYGRVKVPLKRTNDLGVKAYLPSAIHSNDTIDIPIAINNNKYKLWLAFCFFNIPDTMTIDTNFQFIQNQTHLVISGDTAKYYIVTGSKKGQFKCKDVSLIVRDSQNNFYFENVTFDYTVK